MIYFTADLHLYHDQPFIWEPRGCTTSDEHVEYIIEKWNSVVTDADDVYILGDLMLNDTDNGLKALNRLNGNKKIIIGNHDTDRRIDLYNNVDNTEVLGFGARLQYKHYKFYLSHYPTLVSNFDTEEPLKRQVINLCGHYHTKNKFFDIDRGLIYHVELDAHNCVPVSIDDIIYDLTRYTVNNKYNKVEHN